MLLEVPVSPVEERDDLDVQGYLADTTCSPPSSLELLAAREDLGPGVTKEVGHEDDERPLDRNESGFELDGGQ